MQIDDEYIDVTLRWVNVEKIKPTEEQWVLGATPTRTEMGVWMDGKFACPDMGYISVKITHWAEIPKVPSLVLRDEK